MKFVAFYLLPDPFNMMQSNMCAFIQIILTFYGLSLSFSWSPPYGEVNFSFVTLQQSSTIKIDYINRYLNVYGQSIELPTNRYTFTKTGIDCAFLALYTCLNNTIRLYLRSFVQSNQSVCSLEASTRQNQSVISTRGKTGG